MEHYRARIELNSREDPAPDILYALEGYSPKVGRSHRGLLELTLTVPADGLRQALNTSVAIVDWAIDLDVLALEVGFPPVPNTVNLAGWRLLDANPA